MVILTIVLAAILAYVVFINYKENFKGEFNDYKEILSTLYSKDGFTELKRNLLNPLWESIKEVASGLGWLLMVLIAPVSLAVLQIVKIILDVHQERK